MDTLRGSFNALDEGRDYDAADEASANDMPPAIGQDERRMQVRAYNHWAGLLDERNFPSIDDLDPESLPDFGPYSVLLDFSAGIENPGIAYLGDKLAVECDVTDEDLQSLSDVPARSLLSRITDHYMQILANQAPIGFEAEFVNQRGNTILYRGILLPYSSDDETIDFIYGVINWKELADQHTSDELLLEIDQALEVKPEPAPARKESAPLTDWADGPGALAANDVDNGDEPTPAAFVSEEVENEGLPRPTFDPRRYVAALDDEDEDEDEDDGELPAPTFGLSAYNPSDYSVADVEDDEGEEEEDDGKYAGLVSAQELENAKARKEPLIFGDPEDFEEPQDFGEAMGFVEPEGFAPPSGYDVPQSFEARPRLDEPQDFELDEVFAESEEEDVALPEPTQVAAEDMELGDWLAAAREMAAAANSSEDRTRNALYEAIGRAYDFSLAAAEAPGDFEELLSDNGLTVQDRAPMTPVVKLVFGADYDKTRLTEYAAALSYAHRCEVKRGNLAEYLRHAEGGLKGVVKAERRLRREEAGKPVDPVDGPREALAARLRAMEPIALDDIDAEGNEFALVMVRRTEAGELLVLGEVPEDIALLERAARKLVG